MKFALSICPALMAGILLAGCVSIRHVPPGESLNEAYAKKGQLVALPAPPPQVLPVAAAQAPVLPSSVHTEKVADAYTLGNLCLQQGRFPEAIAAYEAALKEDPTFAEAWNNLAIAYQDLGQDDKAMEAFRKYKMAQMH
jgi:tetratricopeptide (TPR) repeat protein